MLNSYNSRYQSINSFPETETGGTTATMRTENNYYYNIIPKKHVLFAIGLCQTITSTIIAVIVVIVSLYVIGILIGMLYISFSICFQTVMVYIFGKDAYYKNFAICSDMQYISANCYTITNTYCNA